MRNFRKVHVKQCQKLKLRFSDLYGKYIGNFHPSLEVVQELCQYQIKETTLITSDTEELLTFLKGGVPI